jgi:hypothetical protein
VKPLDHVRIFIPRGGTAPERRGQFILTIKYLRASSTRQRYSPPAPDVSRLANFVSRLCREIKN